MSSILSLAYSTDADDAFMFWAVQDGAERIDTDGLRFRHVREDTQTLNQAALVGKYDVTALSIASYPRVFDHYQLLPHGGSVGDGYGPVVVAPRPLTIQDLSGLRVAIPGEGTTAYLVLRLIAPDVATTVIPITPFERIFEAIAAGEVDAGLLIHEGRLTYESRGLHKVVDLGEWWLQQTQLPLPLGGNVIRRRLGPTLIRRASAVLRNSIAFSLEHRDEAIAALLASGGTHAGIDEALLDRYLKMYANHDTLDYGDSGRRATAELFSRASAAGLLPSKPPLDWAP